ncbi:MAG: peptidylprolyl isomerase [Betaproteobacteria bacterium]|nr:MAG: peptidylprolyl isomerase [Betaproteobacteria bacterium]
MTGVAPGPPEHLIIAKNTVVSLDVELSDIWGKLIQRSEEPLQYLHGGYGNIFPVAEAALEGRQVKDRVEVRLEPEDAFGDYDETLLRVEPRGRFPEILEVGMRFEGAAGGEDADLIFTVTDMAEDKVVLDANHALAGMALKLSCTVVGLRPATEVEIQNGSADDPESVILRILP